MIFLFNNCNYSNQKALSTENNKLDQKRVTQLNVVGHWLNEGKREDLISEMVGEFEFRNPQIKVNLKFPEELYLNEANDYKNSDETEREFIVSQCQLANSEWDVIRIKEHYPDIAHKLNDPYWGEKYLVDFSEVPGFLDSHISTMDFAGLKQRTGGICVGPYIEGVYWALFVNKKIADKIGIKVKQYDMTFNDLLDYIKILSEYNNKNKTSIIPIFEDKSWISCEAIFTRLFFSLLNNYDKYEDKSSTPEILDALNETYNALEKLSEYKAIRNNRLDIVWSRDNDYILKDSCLFFVNGSWMYNIWQKKNPGALNNIIPCELPVFKPSDVYISSYTSNWAVPNNSPNKQAATKFLMFWCSNEMAVKWINYTKCPTGIKGNIGESGFGLDIFENFMLYINKKYSKKRIAVNEYNNVINKNKNINIDYHIVDVLQGTMSAKEAIRKLQEQLTTL